MSLKQSGTKKCRPLYSKQARGIKLTGQGRLLLSQAVTPTGLELGKLIEFAEDDFERSVAMAICRMRPNLLATCQDPLKGLFSLFCYYVPLFCRTTVSFHTFTATEIPMWLGQHSVYLLAYERLCIECYGRWRLEKRHKSKVNHDEPRQTDTKSFNEWLANAGYLYWLRRFREWRGAAYRSFQYYLKTNARRMGGPDPDIRQAAFLGALSRFSKLPDMVFSEPLGTALALATTAKVFQASKTRKSRLRGLALNCWLTEIWPVVRDNDWTYHDVQKVAERKFEPDEDVDPAGKTPTLNAGEPGARRGPLETAKLVEDRCKSLDLRLSAAAKTRAGSPPLTDTYPPLASVALFIRSIAENPADWIKGQIPDLQE